MSGLETGNRIYPPGPRHGSPHTPRGDARQTGHPSPRRHQKPRMFQGSVVAAACCVIAAVVVIVTSFHTGSFTAILGGPQVQGELSPAAPGYTQSQAEQDPYEIVVEWNRSTHIAVSEGVALPQPSKMAAVPFIPRFWRKTAYSGRILLKAGIRPSRAPGTPSRTKIPRMAGKRLPLSPPPMGTKPMEAKNT